MDKQQFEQATISSKPSEIRMLLGKGKGKGVQTLFSKPADNKEAVEQQAGQGVAEDNVPLYIKPPSGSKLVDPSLIQEFILESLVFTSMYDRQGEVAEAHQRTFEWIFEETTHDTGTTQMGSNFRYWLTDMSSQGGIYWINGKAGSGKSTLLRYIYDHKKTYQLLCDWATSSSPTGQPAELQREKQANAEDEDATNSIHVNPKTLTMAGFFFWTSGSLEQRSQIGLLRSLLHQLLGAHRYLIPVTFPGLWEMYLNMSTKQRINTPISWNLVDLMNGLKLFLKAAVEKTKVCLFIDGLDEYDGDHVEIIGLFKDIVDRGSQNVKVCLSSRPWPVFETAFGSIPHLKLQDRTISDQQRYVVDIFNNSHQMRRILDEEPERGGALIANIVENADGVFLWIILVVRSLLDGLCPGDSLGVVDTRFKILPTDLEELFQHTLFDGQTEIVKREASRILQLIRAREVVCEFTGDHSSSSLTLWEFSLAYLTLENISLPAQTNTITQSVGQESNPVVCQLAEDEVLRLCAIAKASLGGYGAGLLAIHSRPIHSRSQTRFGSDINQCHSLTDSKVTYLHRTVRDWLIHSPSVWETIVRYGAISVAQPNSVIEINSSSHEAPPQGYDPHAALLGAYTLQLKMPLEEPEHHRRLDDWWPGIVLSLTHGRYSVTGIIAAVDELEKTLSWYWLKKMSQPDDHWARNAFGSYEERAKSTISYPFLGLATKFGLQEYVTEKVRFLEHDKKDLGYKGGRPLLSYATDFLINRRKSVYPLSNCSFVSDLLSAGEDPNLVYTAFDRKEETPWLSCIKLLREALRRGWISQNDHIEVKRWTQILRCFVDYGADVNAIIVATKWDPEITVLEVVDSVIDKFGFDEVQGLRDAMVARGGKSVS